MDGIYATDARRTFRVRLDDSSAPKIVILEVMQRDALGSESSWQQLKSWSYGDPSIAGLWANANSNLWLIANLDRQNASQIWRSVDAGNTWVYSGCRLQNRLRCRG